MGQSQESNQKDEAVNRKVITSDNAPKSIGPFSQAIQAGDFIFISGQGAFVPTTGKLVEGGIKEQTRQVIENIRIIVESAGSSLDGVVKVSIFLTDWKYFNEMNEVYAEYFKSDPPARSTIQGQRFPEGHLIAMEAIALAK
jgi:2-iminobutanoate/2-iminopropanoate deaminase